MGNACKFSKREPLQNAIISAPNDKVPLSSNIQSPKKEELDRNLESPDKINQQKNILQAADRKMASEKTAESFQPPKENNLNPGDFEESAPKQFVEVQINRLNKDQYLKNEENEPENEKDVFF